MTPIDDSRFEALKAAGNLPSPKGPALAVIRLTQRADVSVNELARAISADPAFVGKLIKASNTAATAGRRPVVSVGDAVSALGISTVRTLALGFSLVSEYSKGACPQFDYAGFWSRSLMCAIALQAVVRQARILPPEEAFCLGLLSDVGSLGFATIFPEAYGKLVGEGGGDNDLEARERETFALSRHELSVAMMRDWGIPQGVVDPVQYLLHPESAPYENGSRPFQLLHALVLARYIATICVSPEADWRSMMPQLFMLGGRLSLEADALTELCDATVREWHDWGAMLNVKTKELPAFADMSSLPAAPQMPEGMPVVGGEDGYRMRVLVVDDERAMRAVLSAILKEAGHEVYEAADGQQGFEIAVELRPQIMIVDWMMPGMNGIELVRALRETTVGRGIYILLVTSIEEDGALVDAFEAGVDDFMSKPLRPKVLAARLRAGQRVIKLQQEVEKDREEIRRFAAELAVTNSKLQQVALTDFLTGFPNRRYAMGRLQQEWAACQRNGHALSCMVVDVDRFKQVNDNFGHDIGDLVLKRIAAALKSAVRAEDVICRVGGDEFLIICPNSDLDSALRVGERLRTSVHDMEIVMGDARIRSSLSVGVAERDPSMVDMDDLIKRADEGAYLSKDRGRNRVTAIQRTKV